MSNLAKKILIVDGYNVLRSSGFYDPTDDWTDEWYNHAREALLNDISAQYNYTVVIVYDAAKRPSHKKMTKLESININKINTIFTPTGVSADSQIEKLAYEAINQGFKVTIATSDNIIRNTTSNKRITHISAVNFCEHLQNDKITEKISHTNQKNSSNAKIIDTLDEETIKKLKNITKFPPKQ